MEIYSTPDWLALAARAKARDGHLCTVARILGGECSGVLHAHHVIPISEGGDPLPPLDGIVTACAGHHRTLHALREFVAARRVVELPPCRCRGGHRYREGRQECRRRRMARARIGQSREVYRTAA
jgi:hypothetical protein